MLYIRLFFEFFLIGLFSIGGGLATLPFITDLSIRTGWFSSADINNMIAVSECTPGPLGVNMATYVGNITGGIPGGLIATLGLITPSFIIIIIVAHFLEKFRDAAIVQKIMWGLRPASTALIAVAMCSVARAALLNEESFTASGNFMDLFQIKAVILAVILIIAIRKTKLHPIVFIGISAVIGILLGF